MTSNAQKLRRRAHAAVRQGKPCPCCGAVPVAMEGGGHIVGHEETCPTLKAWKPAEVKANSVEVAD